MLIAGIAANISFLWLELARAPPKASTWAGKALVIGNGLGIVKFAWIDGLCGGAEQLWSKFGIRLRDNGHNEFFNRLCLWYLGTFGFLGALAGLAPEACPLAVLGLGIEKYGAVWAFSKVESRFPKANQFDALSLLAWLKYVRRYFACKLAVHALTDIHDTRGASLRQFDIVSSACCTVYGLRLLFWHVLG